MVIGGLVTNVNGVARGRVARFNVDGTLDLAFAPAALLPVGTVINGVAVDRNTNTFLSANVGKVVIGGTFTNAGATLRGRIARLNPDGTLDITFQNGLAGADNTVDAVAVQSDGKVLLVGAFSSVNGVARGGIARLNADGTLDTGFMNGLSGADAEVRAVLVDEAAVTVPAGGYLYVAGDFSSLNGTSRSKVARLFLASGALDTGFVPPTAVNGAVRALALAGNGELLIGGDFTSVGGAGRNRLARLTSGGALQTFLSAVGEGADNFVTGLLVSNGKIVVAGAFSTVNGQGRAGLVRLNDDGTLDASINFGSGANAQVNALGVQADGRLVAAGAFTSFNGTVAGRLVRLDGGLNSDSGTFTFSSATYTATESAGSVGLAIVRSGGLNNSPVISYSVSSGAGNIASLTPATSITFAAGQVSSNLTVNLLPDNTTVQADRTAVITLSSAGTGTLGTPISATLTIQDDDSVIGFAQTGYTVSEGGGTASITVARLGGVAGTVQVDYATVAETGFGKATAVSDYTGVNNTLTFTSGVTNLAFTIPIIQDALTEGNETVTLALFNARPQVVGGASATLASSR